MDAQLSRSLITSLRPSSLSQKMEDFGDNTYDMLMYTYGRDTFELAKFLHQVKYFS